MKTPWRSLLDEAISPFLDENPWHSGHRICPSAMREYPWAVPLLDPVASLLGPPQVSIDPANCDSYGGPPWDHGIIIAWNARPLVTREGWGERDIETIDPDLPSIALWLGCHENASCLGRCLPHPKWRIGLDHDGTFRDRYHSLPEFRDLCLRELGVLEVVSSLSRDPPGRLL